MVSISGTNRKSCDKSDYKLNLDRYNLILMKMSILIAVPGAGWGSTVFYQSKPAGYISDRGADYK